METLYRPSHADYTYQAKYGIRNWQGGGRASARETIGRVAGGAVAKQVFKQFLPKLEIVAFVSQVHDLTASVPLEKISYAEVESNIVRWPDQRRRRAGHRADRKSRARRAIRSAAS